MNQSAQIILLVILLAYVLFWGTIIYIGIPREQRNKSKIQYDERQIYEPSRACKYSYITLIVYLVIYGLLDVGFDIIWCESMFGICLGIAFSLSVFFSYCVFQDAYLAIGESKLAVLLSPNIIALPQLIMGIESVTEGRMIENGIVTNDGLHFLFVGLVLFLDILVFIRKRMDKRSA